MNTVNFIQMRDGTKEEYQFLAAREEEFMQDLPDKLLDMLRALEGSLSGYRVSRLEHSLQSATRAHDVGESTEMVVACLLHDVADNIAPASHSEVAAGILRPYVSEKIYWIVKHHGLFQMYYYAHYFNKDRDARKCFKQHQWYQDTIDFCENYDQNCFDPEFKSKPLEFFEPMVREVFAKPKEHFV